MAVEEDYEHLLVAMAICTLTWKKIEELIAQLVKLEDKVKSLGQIPGEFLWVTDLDALEKELGVIKQCSPPINVVLDVKCFTFSHSVILIQVLDTKFEAEQKERRYRREGV